MSAETEILLKKPKFVSRNRNLFSETEICLLNRNFRNFSKESEIFETDIFGNVLPKGNAK